MKNRCLGCSLFNAKKPVEWKPIKGYEEKYLISDKGEVQHWDDNKKEWKSKTVKKPDKHNRYYRVRLSKSGKIKLKYLHRLVAEAFIDNPENKKTVNHKNMDKSLNCVDNLEWMTQEENNQHYEANK